MKSTYINKSIFVVVFLVISIFSLLDTTKSIETLTEWEAQCKKPLFDCAKDYNQEGMKLYEQNEFQDAESAYQVADVLINLAGVEEKIENSEQLEQAIELYRKAINTLKADITLNRCENFRKMNKLGDAFQTLEECFEQAQDLYFEDYQANLEKLQSLYNSEGLIFLGNSNYEEAIRKFNNALVLEPSIGKPNDPPREAYYRTLFNLALAQYYTGDYTGDYTDSRDTLESLLKYLNKEGQALVSAYGLLAIIEYKEENFEIAKQHNQKALKMARRLLGEEHLLVADLFINLARDEEAVGNFVEAEKQHKKAIDVYKKRYPDGHERVMKGYRAYGNFLNQQDRHQDAEAAFKKASDIANKVLSPTNELVAGLKSDRATNLCDLERFDEGLLRIREALEITEFNKKKNSVKYGDFLRIKANCEKHYSRLSGNETQLNFALKSIREVSENRKVIVLENTKRKPEFLVQQLTKFREDFIENMLIIDELGLSQSVEYFDETLQLSQMAQASRASLAIKKAEVGEKRESEKKTIRRFQKIENDYKDAHKELESLKKNQDLNKEKIKAKESEIENIEVMLKITQNDLQSSTPTYFEYLMPRPMSLEEIQNKLIPNQNQAVINFLVTSEKILSWGVTADDYYFHIYDINQSALLNQIERLREKLEEPTKTGLRPKDLKNFPFEITDQLYRQLLDPLLKQFNLVDNLLIVPDGPLHSLPFGVLTDNQITFDAPTGSPLWLIKDYAIKILPSLETLTFSSFAETFNQDNFKFVGFGDPLIGRLFDVDNNNLISRKGTINSYDEIQELAPLPNTRRELELISKNFKPSNSSLYLGENATEKALRELDLQDVNILVFATHALLSNINSAIDEPAIVLTPISTTNKNNDGILLSSEVNNLKLNTDLVILSACNTASTGKNNPQAYAGLAESFFFAGAKSIMATHWEVETNSAVEITTGLISHLSEDDTTDYGEALRLSVLDLITNKEAGYTHPYFWAPFLIIGVN